MPRAMSKLNDPEEIASISTTDSFWPNFITEPLPNDFSIWPIAISSAFNLSSEFSFNLYTSATMLFSYFAYISNQCNKHVNNL